MICVEEGGMEAISWLSIISPASSIRTILGLEMGIVFANERNCVHQKLTTNEQTKGSFRKIKKTYFKKFFCEHIFGIVCEQTILLNERIHWTNVQFKNEQKEGKWKKIQLSKVFKFY